MSEKELEQRLMELFLETYTEDLFDEFKMVRTFEEIGLLSSNKGVVLTLADGSEFQITIVQSRSAS